VSFVHGLELLVALSLETEHTESLFLLRRHLGNWPCGAAVSMRSQLLVAHEKPEQLPLLTVYVVPVKGEKYISCLLLKLHHSFVYTLYLFVSEF
jgi:hypothetical protein